MINMNKLITNPCDSCLTGWAICDKNGCKSCTDTCGRHKKYIETISDKIIDNIFRGIKT